MEVVIRPDAGAVARLAADVVAVVLRGPAPVLGLATGSSPLGTYAELRRRHRVDGLSFARATAFLLDEYVGLPAAHPQRYRAVIDAELAGRVDLRADAVHAPDALAADVPAADAVAAAVEGPLSASCPASVLQLHPHATVLVDDAAAARLRRAEHYREVYAAKPPWQGL